MLTNPERTRFHELGQRFLTGVMKRQTTAKPADRQRQFRFLSAEQFLTNQFHQDWLVKLLLVTGEPVVLGGPKKALKTSIMLDLAASLASGDKFLGYFDVPRCVPVGVVSGESGGATLQKTFRRICLAKHIFDPDKLPVFFETKLPKLGERAELDRLAAQIKDSKLKVVFLDPLYLCLIGMKSGVNAASLYEMGPLLSNVAEMCLQAGATPILLHHARKAGSGQTGRRGRFEPMELDGLAFAGISEFARQWLLIARREQYDPDSGTHRLWLSIGGSAGQSGCYAVDVEEGKMGEDFGGRMWQVMVKPASTARDEKLKEQEKKTLDSKKQKLVDAKGAIVKALSERPDGETMSALALLTGLSKDFVKGVLGVMLDEHRVEQCKVEKAAGHSKVVHKGFRLAIPDDGNVAEYDERDFEDAEGGDGDGNGTDGAVAVNE